MHVSEESLILIIKHNHYIHFVFWILLTILMYRDMRQGENGITKGLMLIFAGLSFGSAWSILLLWGAIGPRLLHLSIRATQMILITISIVYLLALYLTMFIRGYHDEE